MSVRTDARLPLTALLIAASVLCSEALAAPRPQVTIRSVSNVPERAKPGRPFTVDVSVARSGAGFRSGVVVYYLSPRAGLTAGAVRLGGQTPLAVLRRRRVVGRRTRLVVPQAMPAGRYSVIACPANLRVRGGTLQATRCRASAKRVAVVVTAPQAGQSSGGSTSSTSGTPTPPPNPDPAPTPNPDPNTDADKDTSRVAIFPWVTSGGVDDNWLEGLGFAALGLLGALVTIYLFLGDFLPSMGGKAEYEDEKLKLDELVEQRNAQLAFREKFVGGDKTIDEQRLAASDSLTEHLDHEIGQKEAQIRRERRRLFAIAMPVYLVLGGAFAVLAASNTLQALLIGFGWTAVADRFGMTRELEVRKAKKDQAVGEIKASAKASVEAATTAEREAKARVNRLEELQTELLALLKQEKTARKKAETALTKANPKPQRAGDGGE